MGPPPPASLPDELVEEILLRIPPSDPATLARAAVAQKRWCRLVTDDDFRRRYRALHRTPPMLGFFCDPRNGDCFVPASSFRPKPRGSDHSEFYPEDARHGRVLLIPGHGRVLFRANGCLLDAHIPQFGLVVWDPITGHQVVLPRPKGFCDKWNWKATVLCAAPAGSCDHLDCHRGHFIVVLIGDYPNSVRSTGMLSCLYSSQAGAWSKITFDRRLGGACKLGQCSEKRSAHVGNALYCLLDWQNKILKYDLGTREFSVMERPPLLSCEEFRYICSQRIELATMEDGQLGLAVLHQSTLYILSMDEEFRWGGTKIIDLEKCSNYVPSTTKPFLVGFAGGTGLVFMKAENNGISSVNIKSAQVKVVDKRPCISSIVPYINFCTPAMGVPSKDDKPRAGSSRDVQSCVASSLLRQAVDTGGQSQRPVGSHQVHGVRLPQPRRLRLAFLLPRPQLGHSPPPQGK